MEKEIIRFNTIVDTLCIEHPLVTPGKMMSSPAVLFKNKVFAFYYRQRMVFKLGSTFSLESLGVHHYQVLAPFKTKPPLVDWFEVMATDMDHWETLARHALEFISQTVK